MVSWTIVGEGLIHAEAVGAHRVSPVVDDPGEEDAYRRAFWVWVVSDLSVLRWSPDTLSYAGSFA